MSLGETRAQGSRVRAVAASRSWSGLHKQRMPRSICGADPIDPRSRPDAPRPHSVSRLAQNELASARLTLRPRTFDFAIPGLSSFALSTYISMFVVENIILNHVTQLPPPTCVYTAHTFSRKRPTHAHSQSTSLSSLECSLIYSSRAASGDGPVLSRVYIHPLKATKKTNGGAAVCQTTKQGAG